MAWSVLQSNGTNNSAAPGSSGTTSATSPLTWSHTCGASATVPLAGVT